MKLMKPQKELACKAVLFSDEHTVTVHIVLCYFRSIPNVSTG